MVKLCIGQQNVGRSFTAMNQLKVDLNNYDVVCVQESAVLSSGKSGGAHDAVAPYCSGAGSRTAVLVPNRDIPVTELFVSRDIVAVLLDLDQIVVVSVYFEPDKEIDEQLLILEDLLVKHKDRNILLLGDFNAKSAVWGNPLHKSNDRGDLILELTIQHGLTIYNNPQSDETFHGSRGTS